METLVVGAGEMGRWAGSVLADRGSVAFADRDPTVAERAAETIDGRVVPLETESAFDTVVLAVPIPAVAGAIRQHAPKATGALVDLAGTMATPMEAYAEYAVSEYASFHPLFAPPRAPGRIAYVPGEVGATVGRVRSAFAATGNDVFETTAADHDTAMESVQGAAHAAVLAYALATDDVADAFATPVSAALEDVARTVTSGDPRVYADVREEFDGADRLAEAAASLAEADGDRFRELFHEARDRVGADPRGEITDAFEVDGVSDDAAVTDETDEASEAAGTGAANVASETDEGSEEATDRQGDTADGVPEPGEES